MIDIKKLENSDVSKEVLDVYKRVKRDLIDDADRKDWLKIRKRNWNAAYPLDPEKDDTIWTAKEREQMIAKGQIPVAVNDLARDIQGSSAVITSKSPGLNFLPIGSSDLYVAELFKRGWDYVLNGNDGPVSFYDFVKEAKIGHLGVMEARHDSSQGIFGKIVLECIDPTTYYFDKRSKTRNHSDVSFGKAHQVTKEYALETYEGLTEDDLMFSEMQNDENAENVPDYKTGKDNYAEDTGDKPGQGPDEKEPENIWEIEDWELKKERELWLMIPDASKPYGFIRESYKNYADIEAKGWTLSPDKKEAVDSMGAKALIWKRLVTKRIQRIIVGKKMVEKEVNPLGIDAEGVPVTPIVTLQHDRTLSGYPTGPTSRALELTRSRNKRRMQSIYVVSKNVDAPKVLPQGAKWVKDEVHGDYIEVSKDTAFPPTQLPPANSSAELINLEQIDKQDIHDEYQINDVIQGKIPAGQSNMAGRTVLALQDMVGVISSPNVLTFESAIVRLGKAVCAIMLTAWPRQMWQRLIEPDEMQTWQPEKEKQVDPQTGKPVPPEPSEIQQKWMKALELLRPEDPTKEPGISLIDLDVKIMAGSTQPTNRMAKQAVALDMMKIGAYDAQAVLDYTDDPKKDEITERLKKRRQEELQAMAQGQAMKGGK